MLKTCRDANLPALPVWSAVRMAKLDDAPPWMMADVVGMQQLDATDHEACFARGRHNPGEVMGFLRGLAGYTLDRGNVIQSGHTTDGPGGIWRALEVEEAIIPAPRRVIRWFPEDGSEPPAALRAASRPSTETGAKRGLFGRLKSVFGR